MAKVVIVHGISQQFKGSAILHSELAAPLVDGLAFAKASLSECEVVCAFYGDLFRPIVEVLGSSVPAASTFADLDETLLALLWCRAAKIDNRVIPPDAEVLARMPEFGQRALRALSRSKFFGDLGVRALVGNLRQVQLYFTESQLRTEAQARVANVIDADTLVLVAHSLGSIVSYEALCANPHWGVRSLVTVGSPLGLRHVVFDRLCPPPRRTGEDCRLIGCWPGAVRHWTNIADSGDVVAAVEDLRPLFGDAVKQIRIYNGSRAHDMRSYLTAEPTGRAVAEGLGHG